MYFIRAYFFLLVTSLSLAQLPRLPGCSISCFLDAMLSDGCESLVDFACHCQKPQLVEGVTPCVRNACPIDAQSSVSNAVTSQCSSVGHPITLPPVEEITTTTTTTATTENSHTSPIASSSHSIPISSPTHIRSSSAVAPSSSSPGPPPSLSTPPACQTSSPASATPPSYTGTSAKNARGDMLNMIVGLLAAYLVL